MGKDTEYRFIYTKGSGPGGQHKNKVESCITVEQIPSGLRERCDETRSKLQNKELALSRLKKKIEELAEEKQHLLRNKHRNEILQRKVRTYNYKTGLAKDHRTSKTLPLGRILNGDLNLIYGD